MIYLFISTTFFSAMVLGSIANTRVSGIDGLPGLIRQNDTVVFRAQATYPLSITSYFTNNNYVSMSCTGSGGNYDCSYQTVVNNAIGEVWGTLREITPPAVSGASVTIGAYPDFIPPYIWNLVPSSMGNRVRVEFTIEDPVSPACSGFKKVDLYLNNQLVNSTNYTVGLCRIDGGVLEGSIPNYVGPVNISFKIEDYMGGKDNETYLSDTPILIATKKPVIRTSSVKVYRPGTTTEVRAVTNNTNFVRDVDVSVEIESASLELNRVFADFTEFDQTHSVDQSNLQATCHRDAGWTTPYTCTFRMVKLSPADLRPSFVVYATDDMDNFANATLSTTFTRHTGANALSARVYRAGTSDQITKISTNQTANERTVDIAVDITDSVAVTSASGDFTEINRNGGQSSVHTSNCYINESASTETTSHYTCVFQGLRFKPATISPSIIIRVTDEIGATTEKSIRMSFQNVPNAGTVGRLGPEPSRCVSGRCYVRPTGNNITAEISGASTFLESNVLLQGSPSACAQEGSRWVCQEYLDFSQSDNRLYLTGTDDYGNQISAMTNITVDDNTPVRLTDIRTSPSCPISSETLKISVNVSEQTSPGVIISADTSAISDNAETRASCTKIGNTKNYNCILSVNNLKEEEINSEIQLVVEDLAGNRIEGIEPIPVSVCVPIEGEIPDKIAEIRTTGTLPRIDKKTASKIIVKAPVGLEIVLSDEEAEVVDQTKPSCAGSGLQGGYYTIGDTGLKPILILPLKYHQDWDDEDKVIVNCSQQFKIKIGNRIYTEKEPENYTINLTAYNQPLGSLDQAYEKKVDEIKENIRKLDKSIKKYDKIGKTLKSVCAFAEGMGKINQIVQSARAFASLICTIPIIGEGAFNTINRLALKFDKYVNRYVWPQGWKKQSNPSNAPGLLIKTVCFIYTCKFYDMNEVARLIISLTVSGQKAKDKISSSPDSPGPNANNGFVEGMSKEEYVESLVNMGGGGIIGSGDPNDNENIGGHVILSNQITGNGILSGIFGVVGGAEANQPWSAQEFQSFDWDIRINNAIDAFLGSQGTWVYNPFKSKHYDTFCHPAIVFNKRKEMQLLCKRLGCIELMAREGGPIEACEYDYSLGMCIYVDSARYKLHGNWDFLKVFGSLVRSLFNNLLGGGITAAFLTGCKELAEITGNSPLACNFATIPDGICKVAITFLNIREIISFAQNPYNPITTSGVPTDPIEQSGGPDFCSGVNWQSEE